MPASTKLRHLRDELTVIYRNLGKDNAERRENLAATNRKLEKISCLKTEFSEIKTEFNSEENDTKVIEEAKKSCRFNNTIF